MIRVIFIILLFISFPANARLDIDVSEPVLEISTGFTGDVLTLFGSATPHGDLVILVKGPQKNITMRRKSDIWGLWVRSTSIEFEKVYGYYNVASSRPVRDIASQKIRFEYNMGINSLNYSTSDADISASKRDKFHEALIQNNQLNGLYSLTPNAVEFINDNLFKTKIYMPANVPLGQYEIEAFLFKEGKLIDRTTHPFKIQQVGTAANVHNFAYERPFWYGISVILIAILSSFLAILLLRRE